LNQEKQKYVKRVRRSLKKIEKRMGGQEGFSISGRGLRSEPRLFGTNIANTSRDLEQISQTPQRREAKMTLEVQVSH